MKVLRFVNTACLVSLIVLIFILDHGVHYDLAPFTTFDKK